MTIRDEIDKIKNDVAQVSKISAVLANEKLRHKLELTRIAAIILAVLLVVTNVLWYLHAQEFEKVTETTETITFEGFEQYADGDGNNNIAGGDITYGDKTTG